MDDNLRAYRRWRGMNPIENLKKVIKDRKEAQKPKPRSPMPILDLILSRQKYRFLRLLDHFSGIKGDSDEARQLGKISKLEAREKLRDLVGGDMR